MIRPVAVRSLIAAAVALASIPAVAFPTQDTAVIMQPNAFIWGALEEDDAIRDGARADRYRLIAEAGRSLRIEMRPAAKSAPDELGLDPYLVLLDGQGNVVAEDDNGGGLLAARIDFEVGLGADAWYDSESTHHYTVLATQTTGGSRFFSPALTGAYQLIVGDPETLAACLPLVETAARGPSASESTDPAPPTPHPSEQTAEGPRPAASMPDVSSFTLDDYSNVDDEGRLFDIYSKLGHANRAYVVDVLSSEVVLRVQVENFFGEVLGSARGGSHSRVSFALEEDIDFDITVMAEEPGARGTYFVVVTESPVEGDPAPEPDAGNMASQEAAGASAMTPTTIEPGQEVEGTLAAGDDFLYPAPLADPFTFQGEAGQRVVFRMRSLAAGLAPYLQLRDADDDPIAESGPASPGDRFQEVTISHSLPASGAYRILASQLNMGAASQAYGYVLSFEEGSADSASEAADPEDGDFRRIAPGGGPISGRLEAGDGIRDGAWFDEYRVWSEAGEVLHVEMTGGHAQMDPFLVIEGPGGELLAEDDDSGGDRFARISFAVPETGEYRIIATHVSVAGASDDPAVPFEVTAGDYELRLTSEGPHSGAPVDDGRASTPSATDAEADGR